ncbi:MAG: N-6 DNA methylase [Snowella sp.]|nr:N-6 DNA methylase [Snowella sp.]
MNNIKDISFWKQNFGLLPIHLFSSQEEESSFIMLNGGYGDFCLQTDIREKSPDEYYSFSWSSNTKNFVVLNDENVNIYNWKKGSYERVTKKQVEENSEKFYQYLVKNSYKSSDDIVPFIVDIFKQLRNFTQERLSAVEALNLLFLLLASIEYEDVKNINFKEWNLNETGIPSNFYSYTERLKQGFKNVKPKLDLIIRHSSGILFQEAQKEVLFFDRQVDFWGNYSSKSDIKKSSYSSIHYTPPYLARSIVENAIKKINLSKSSLKIFDPACGSSEFLIEVLKQLKELRYQGEIQIIGWDSSLIAINTSMFLLKYEQNRNWNQKMAFEIRLVEDSLCEEWGNDYDLIVMNPPFLSWEQMNKKTREVVTEVLREVLIKNTTGKPNQASAFFYKSILSLNQDGIVGSVIPSSLLSLDTYLKLRNTIYDLININLIGKLGNFIFEDALTDVSLIVGYKPKTDSIPLVLWTKNEKGFAQNALRDLRKIYYSGLFKIEEKNYNIYKPNSFPINTENWKIISSQDYDFFKMIERFVYEDILTRIQDIFSVHQGIRTGNNKVFKISESQYMCLPEAEKRYFRPVLDNKSIQKGQILKSNNYIWYPYDKNGINIHTEEELKEKVPNFYESTLFPNKDGLMEGKNGKKRSRIDASNWWHLSQHRAWLRLREEKPRLVSTEFGKSNSFAFDKEGIFAIERGNAWIPKKEFDDMDYYYFYLSIFSSHFFDKLLSIYSKQLAGGDWYDLGKTHTGYIPVPSIFSERVKDSPAYSQLVAIGKEISNGNYYLRDMIDDVLLKFIYPTSINF